RANNGPNCSIRNHRPALLGCLRLGFASNSGDGSSRLAQGQAFDEGLEVRMGSATPLQWLYWGQPGYSGTSIGCIPPLDGAQGESRVLRDLGERLPVLGVATYHLPPWSSNAHARSVTIRVEWICAPGHDYTVFVDPRRAGSPPSESRRNARLIVVRLSPKTSPICTSVISCWSLLFISVANLLSSSNGMLLHL